MLHISTALTTTAQSATAAEDYTTLSGAAGTATFLANEDEKTVTLTILSDDDVEHDEQFELSIDSITTTGSGSHMKGELWKATVVIDSEDEDQTGMCKVTGYT